MCFVSHCWSFLQLFMLSKIGLTTQECLMTNTLKINKVVNILRLLIIFWRNMLSLFQTNWIFLPNLNETTIGLWFGTVWRFAIFTTGEGCDPFIWRIEICFSQMQTMPELYCLFLRRRVDGKTRSTEKLLVQGIWWFFENDLRIY